MTGLKETFLTALAGRLSPEEIGRWLASAVWEYDRPLAQLRLIAPTVFHQKRLTGYAPMVAEIAGENGYALKNICIEPKKSPTRAGVINLKLEAKSGPGPRFAPVSGANRLDRFIQSPSNRLAVMALETFWPGGRDLGAEALILAAAGPWGKTHLLEALTLALAEEPAGNFLKVDFRAPIRLDQWQRAALIIVDDVHFLADRPDLQQRLMQSFDEAAVKRQRLIISSPCPPHHLSGLGEALRSRLSGALVVGIDPPEYELMAGLGARRAGELGLELSEEELAALTREAGSDPRRLMGLIKTAAFLRAQAGLGSCEVIRRLVTSRAPGQRNVKVEIAEVLAGVSEAFGLKTGDLTGQSKLRQTAWPRRVAMYLARELTGLTTTQIGRALGGRDHSTVIHALKKINEELKNPAQLKMVENIKRSLLMV